MDSNSVRVGDILRVYSGSIAIVIELTYSDAIVLPYVNHYVNRTENRRSKELIMRLWYEKSGVERFVNANPENEIVGRLSIEEMLTHPSGRLREYAKSLVVFKRKSLEESMVEIGI